MCDTCGCGDPDVVPIEVQHRILEGNERIARHNREHFEAAGVLAVNLMGSPGSGKTAVLEATARALRGALRIAAVSGDLETTRDADRLVAAGIRARSITTGTACHLDARLVHEALHPFELQKEDLFFIENVGNLVCPAVYDLGEATRVVVLSVTEGEDKPLKYPVMFRKADLVLLSKIDLVPHLDVDLDAIRDHLGRVMPTAAMLAVSARTGEGIDEWISWLTARRPHRRAIFARPHAH